MKIRKGFVSNSSSSSFILAVPKENKDLKITITKEIEITDYADKKLTTEQEVIDELKNGWYMDADDERFIAALKAVKEGKEIWVGSCCNEGEAEEALLCSDGFEGQKFNCEVEVIDGEGGY